MTQERASERYTSTAQEEGLVEGRATGVGYAEPRLSSDVVGVVIGPCPGCKNWTLEYDAEENVLVVEAMVRDHAAECRPLVAIADERGIR